MLVRVVLINNKSFISDNSPYGYKKKYIKHVADVRKCIISILSYPDGCQDVGYGDDRGSTMPDI